MPRNITNFGAKTRKHIRSSLSHGFFLTSFFTPADPLDVSSAWGRGKSETGHPFPFVQRVWPEAGFLARFKSKVGWFVVKVRMTMRSPFVGRYSFDTSCHVVTCGKLSNLSSWSTSPPLP